MNFNPDQYIAFVKEGLKKFKEWYQPIDFGYGIVADVREIPDYVPKPEFRDSNLRGMGKWNSIIKPNLPDIRGKRVLDLGCNAGLFSIQLALGGAREVIGIDRDQNISQKSCRKLAKQDVIGQAEFVKKAFEMRTGKKVNIKFIRSPIERINEIDIGKFDLVLALCIVYHALSRMPYVLASLAAKTDLLILQTQLSHKGRLGIWSSLRTHLKIMNILGFDVNVVEGPPGYSMPLMICRQVQQKQHRLSYLSTKLRLGFISTQLAFVSYLAAVKRRLKTVF